MVMVVVDMLAVVDADMVEDLVVVDVGTSTLANDNTSIDAQPVPSSVTSLTCHSMPWTSPPAPSTFPTTQSPTTSMMAVLHPLHRHLPVYHLSSPALDHSQRTTLHTIVVPMPIAITVNMVAPIRLHMDMVDPVAKVVLTGMVSLPMDMVALVALVVPMAMVPPLPPDAVHEDNSKSPPTCHGMQSKSGMETETTSWSLYLSLRDGC